MLSVILMGVVVVVAVPLAIVAFQPAGFRYERSAEMAAAPEVIFPQVNNLRNWDAWSPWSKMDPNMDKSFSGPDAGVGAQYAWSGNNQIGEGTMEIVESIPNQNVRLVLTFVRPFKGTNNAEFTFTPVAGGTLVTWAMFGENNFVAKAMGLFMDMDKMIGKNFDDGLADMKAIVEGQ